MAGLECERRAVTCGCVVQPAQSGQGIAKTEMRGGRVCVERLRERQRRPIGRHCIVEPSQMVHHVAEVVMVLRVRCVDGQAVLDELDRGVVVSGLERDHPEQVQRLDLAWI